MKENKRAGIVLGLILGIMVTGFVVTLFMPNQIIKNKDQANLQLLSYEGENLSVNESQILGILEKYSSRRTLKDFFPYDTERVKFQLIVEEEDSPKHILLGDMTVWYESTESKTRSYRIKDGEWRSTHGRIKECFKKIERNRNGYQGHFFLNFFYL